MFLSIGMLVAVVSLFLRGKGTQAILLLIGGSCMGAMLFGIGLLAAGPKLTFDLAHPPVKSACPDWLTHPPQKNLSRHIQFRRGEEKINIFADQHAADFDGEGNLVRLDITDVRTSKEDAVKAIDALADFFAVKTRLRNTQLDRWEGASFTIPGWTVRVQMWNTMATTTVAAQQSAGYRLILER